MLACGQRVLGKGQPKQINNGENNAKLSNPLLPPPRSGFVQQTGCSEPRVVSRPVPLMKIAPWIHCLTQIILAATLIFYFDQLHRHILYLAKGKVYLPVVTHYAIHWRSFLWLIPLAFVASAFVIQRRGVTPDRYAIFSACSILVIIAYHPDNMSGIILDSIWRELNSKPVNAEILISQCRESERASTPPRDRTCPECKGLMNECLSMVGLDAEHADDRLSVYYCRNQHV